jgi:hypothetical protein
MTQSRESNLASATWNDAGGPPVCVYCGSPSRGVVDHVPPVSAASVLRQGEWWAYPVCNVCNRSLGIYPGQCLEDRAVYLMGRLRVFWLNVRLGKTKRVPLYVYADTGRAVSARRASGMIRARCRCEVCAAPPAGDVDDVYDAREDLRGEPVIENHCQAQLVFSEIYDAGQNTKSGV